MKINAFRVWFCCFAIFLGFYLLPGICAADSPIGCERQNQTLLRCWNQGSIEPVTYFMLTGDGLQMANNDTSRFGWATYRSGLHYKNGAGGDVLIDFDDLGLSKSWESDNESFYRLNFSGYLSMGGKEAYFEYIVGQLVDDDYVNFTVRLVTVSGFDAWNKTVSLWRMVKNIDVGGDGDVDTLSLSDVGLSLNFSDDTWLNASEGFLRVVDREDDFGIRWSWEDFKDRVVFVTNQSGSVNNKVYWMRNSSSPLRDGRSYELSEFWIDIPECSFSCDRGGCYFRYLRMRCQDGGFFNNCSNQVSRNMTFKYWISFWDGEFNCNCEPNGGCLISGQHNASGEWENLTGQPHVGGGFNYDAEDFVCLNHTYSECDEADWYQPNPSSTWRTLDFVVECRRMLPETGFEGIHVNLRGWLGYNDWYSINDMDVYCMNDSLNPNVSWVSPGNLSGVNFSESFEVNCSAGDNYPMQNLSLWSNISGSWLAYSVYEAFPFVDIESSLNMSAVNVTDGFVAFYCRGCDVNGFCNESALVFLDLRRLDFDDAWVVAFFVPLVVFGFWYWRRKKKKN